MKKWLRQNRVEVAILTVILLAAAFLRFYRLADYMTFLGDEGRDALMIQRILVDHDFPLLGPPTSVGNIYLGPLYYYMMAASMAIFWLNPVAATGMVALIGILTVYLVYYLARRWFGIEGAILAAFLYAVSPINIIYSRSSWNPNPAPFFALLAMVGLDKARQSRNFLWFILTGASVAAATQMHYLAAILIPIFGVLWIGEFLRTNKRSIYRYFTLGTLGAVGAFLLINLPLIIFDLKYNFMNYRAATALFFGSGAIGANAWIDLSKIFTLYFDKLIGRAIGAQNLIITIILSLLVILPLLILLRNRLKREKISWPFIALGVWLLGGLAGLLLYRSQIYDHYLGFLNPVPYLLLAGITVFLKQKTRWIFVGLLLVVVGIFNLAKTPLLYPANYQLQRTQEVARFIINQSGGKPFNFALIAKNNYDAAYQFYLEQYGHKPKVVPVEVTGQLFVVCEDEICNPVNHPKYEIAGFGWAKIEKVDAISGVKVYKLTPNPSGKPV